MWVCGCCGCVGVVLGGFTDCVCVGMGCVAVWVGALDVYVYVWRWGGCGHVRAFVCWCARVWMDVWCVGVCWSVCGYVGVC